MEPESFADGMCQVKVRSLWIKVDPDPMTGVLTRRKKSGHRHTERRGLCEDRVRDWSDVSINQEMPRWLAITRS